MTSGLPPDFGRLWLAKIDADGLDDTSCLSDTERSRLATMSHPNRRRQFVAGRVLTNRLLASLDLHPASGAAIGLSPSGQPLLPHHPQLYLSISHSKEWIGCAIASVPVGLDIERVTARRATLELISEVCSEAERRHLESLAVEHRERLFTELWTLKEAWLKRLGVALDVARMRAISWSPSIAPRGNCTSWAGEEAMSVTVLGPSASNFLTDAPALVRNASCTTRQVDSSSDFDPTH